MSKVKQLITTSHLSRFKPCLGSLLLPVAVVRLHVGYLHAVGWGEVLWKLMTPVAAIMEGV